MVPPFPISARLVCDTVYGFQSGDTCFDLAKASNLTDKGFLDINPNLNCDDIFVGQWICTSGKLAA
ncbi:unnamed protein product [Linum tenue]|uniref:LysM domain-containing protein n=1 Tax=Linum tenue TaxID=586396 RepID=A0AAV0LLF9_9ROSI|nr:unnamed protein product [Linum tenue]